MSDFQKCSNCGEYDFSGHHKCKPVWYVRPDYYDQGEEKNAFGYDAREAAENFMGKHFSDLDYPHEVTLIVIDKDYKEQVTIEVVVEPVPSFDCSITKTEPYVAEVEE